MKKNYISWLISAAALAILALIGIQVRWMQQSRELLEEQFTNRVNMALCSTVENLASDPDHAEEIRACCKAPDLAACAPNFLPRSQEPAMQAALNQWMQFYQIDLPYTVQITPKDSATKNAPPYSCSLGPVLEGDTHYLQLNFQGKDAYVSERMGLMVLASVVILLFICVIFGLATWHLVRQKRMAERNRDYFNHMTHEFRTPLTNIRLAANLMARKNKNLDGNQYLNIIRRECSQLVHQVENVLQLGGLEKAGYQLHKGPVDLRTLTDEVLAGLDLQIQESAARVEVDQNGADYTIQGDAFHLSNAFRNILDNALKYSGVEPAIKIGFASEATGTRVSFTDNGIGLSATDRRKIFEKFHRCESALCSGKKGFGLGLAYVKKIVDMHQGEIAVSSPEGHGARFELFFPKGN